MPLSWIIVIVALWCVVLYAIVIVAGVARRLSDLEIRSHPRSATTSAAAQLDVIAAGPRIGSALPELPEHPELSAASVGESGRIILMVSSTCGPCLRLAEQLNNPGVAAARPELNEVELVVVTDEAGRERFERFASGGVVIQHAGEISARIGVRATPFAIAIDQGVVVAVGLPGSAADIADLAAKCRRSAAKLTTTP